MSKSFDATTKTFRDYTAEEQADYDARMKIYNDNIVPKKLEQIKKIRLQKLIDTDYLAMSDNVLSNDMKNFRKKMRDIPQDFDSSKYDELLAKDSDGNLTHTIWSKP